jgi:hypothetical protein
MLAQIIHPELFSGLIPRESSVKLSWAELQRIESQRMSERFIPLG